MIQLTEAEYAKLLADASEREQVRDLMGLHTDTSTDQLLQAISRARHEARNYVNQPDETNLDLAALTPPVVPAAAPAPRPASDAGAVLSVDLVSLCPPDGGAPIVCGEFAALSPTTPAAEKPKVRRFRYEKVDLEWKVDCGVVWTKGGGIGPWVKSTFETVDELLSDKSIREVTESDAATNNGAAR